MVNKNTAGFTLIEITIAMAISAALGIIALSGFSSTRGNAQFSSSVNSLKEEMTTIRTEALTTVNYGNNPGTHSTPGNTDVVLGRLVTFTNNSSSVRVRKIVLTVTNDIAGAITYIDDRTTTLPWGLKFAEASKQVAFTRALKDGSNITAVSGAWGVNPTYDQVRTSGGTMVNLHFTDANGRSATIDIDQSTNGIGRTFQ